VLDRCVWKLEGGNTNWLSGLKGKERRAKTDRRQHTKFEVERH
jgi:hypothetical protein